MEPKGYLSPKNRTFSTPHTAQTLNEGFFIIVMSEIVTMQILGVNGPIVG